MNTENLIAEVTKLKEVQAPVWAPFVKTGVSKERPPVNPQWWQVRVASVLCKVRKFGPIGTNRLAKQYGGRQNRGVKTEKKVDGSRNITRKAIQQLEAAGLIKQTTTPKAGKVLTAKGAEFLKGFN
jgi:small subunit ribosomal protein S19e